MSDFGGILASYEELLHASEAGLWPSYDEAFWFSSTLGSVVASKSASLPVATSTAVSNALYKAFCVARGKTSDTSLFSSFLFFRSFGLIIFHLIERE